MDNGASSYRRYLDGDDEGMTELIREHKDSLMLFLNRYVQNIHTAEDLMEDTFVKLVVKKPRFKGECSFKTWLFTIGRNVALDYIRKHKRHILLPDEEISLLIAEENEVWANILKDEQAKQVKNALSSLKDDYRIVLHLSYFDALSPSEIALVMKKSKKQVENLLYRAKLALKKRLEEEGFEYEEL